MSEFVRVLKTTISQYLRDEEINILKDQKFTALLMQKKRISYNHSGQSLTWEVKMARNGLLQYSDAQTLAFTRVNRWQQATLPWRGYAIPEAVTKKEKLMNKGKEAIVRYAERLGESLKDDIEFGFNAQLYVDGTSASNANAIHGIQSFSANNGTAQYPTPNQSSYAGLSTVLGNYGGAAKGGATWPVGSFDQQYYFWSPVFVSYNNSTWGSSTNNWANNCLASLRYGNRIQRNLKGKKQGKLDAVFMEATMYANVEDAISTKERVMVERQGQEPGLVKAGFDDVLVWDGMELTSEADCPAADAFGMNMGSLELCSLQSQLFDLEDMEDINTLSEKMVTTMFGNLKSNPRGFVFWGAYG